MKITADFNKITGKIKPMHGVGQPPFYGDDFSLFHYLTEAGIPYSRLHDVDGWLGGNLYVDIPNLFRDFDADETLPENYDFAFTDRLLKALVNSGVEPFFRLGITIENSYLLKAYRTDPPKDNAKWARICEHVIRHYNEGWNNGYHWNITYWEIWNEPEYEPSVPEGSPMWSGTKEEYFALYETASKHLKQCFGDTIKVGGYASSGFYHPEDDPNCEGKLTWEPIKYKDSPENWFKNRCRYFINYAHDFLQFVKERNCPLDFFSWHTYDKVKDAVESARYVRRMLDKYGFDGVSDILDEWNPYPKVEGRASLEAAAEVLSFMLAMQKEKVSAMNYYDARLGPSCYGGMFNPATHLPYPAYYAFRAFNSLYKLGNECYTESDDGELYVGAAANERHAALVICNLSENPKKVTLNLCGITTEDITVIRLDKNDHLYTVTDECVKDTLQIPAYGTVEIRF